MDHLANRASAASVMPNPQDAASSVSRFAAASIGTYSALPDGSDQGALTHETDDHPGVCQRWRLAAFYQALMLPKSTLMIPERP
jgi:hypothetical protein